MAICVAEAESPARASSTARRRLHSIVPVANSNATGLWPQPATAAYDDTSLHHFAESISLLTRRARSRRKSDPAV